MHADSRNPFRSAAATELNPSPPAMYPVSYRLYAELLHNIFPVEQHVEVLIFRQRVVAAVILIRD